MRSARRPSGPWQLSPRPAPPCAILPAVRKGGWTHPRPGRGSGQTQTARIRCGRACRNRLSRTRPPAFCGGPSFQGRRRQIRAGRPHPCTDEPAMPRPAPTRRMQNERDAAPVGLSAGSPTGENAFLPVELRDASMPGTSSGARSPSRSQAKHLAKPAVPANSDFSKRSLTVSGLPLGRRVNGSDDRRVPDMPSGRRAAPNPVLARPEIPGNLIRRSLGQAASRREGPCTRPPRACQTGPGRLRGCP